MAEIIVKEVLTRRELRRFIYLPAKIHSNNPDWLPPIYNDEWLLFDRKKNKSYKYADAVFYLAYRDKKPVGRIMGLVNNRYNDIKQEKNGRFCFMECFDDHDTASALLRQVEDWLKSRGMEKIVGPLGFSDKDPQGFQIDGFEYPYLFTAATNSAYLPGMMDSLGYEKEIDLVNYNIRMPDSIPSIYNRVFERFIKNGEFEIIEFTSKKELKPYIIPILELMNETFSEIYGFVPLNDPEKLEFANRYLPILDPEFIKVVKSGDVFAGFVIALPDMAKGIIAAKGRLFPFGIFKILSEIRKTKRLMMMLGGIRKEFRGQGVDVLMAIKLLESAMRKKMDSLDSHLILENNSRMRAEYERLNGQVIKRFRIYRKQL